jgi:Tfp pilus assembly protein PilN
MHCTVNLVPLAQRRARSRARHRNAWLVVGGAVSLLVAAGWGVQRVAHASLDRIRSDTATLAAQHAAIAQRLAAASTERDELLERLRRVAAARRPQRWPLRLVELSATVPDGVYLTSLAVTPADKLRPGRNTAAAADPAEDKGPGLQRIQLLGRALDHDTLLQFVAVLQSVPDFQDVTLVRATQAPFGAGAALSFELACAAVEEPR